MPLIRRIPKRGFNNTEFKTRYAVVNLRSLSQFEDGAHVDEQSLLVAGLIRRPYDAVKILGTGAIVRKLKVVVDKASVSARLAIEDAGGSLVLR